MRMPGKILPWITLALIFYGISQTCRAQDYDGGGTEAPPPPSKDIDSCDGIYISYNFQGREKEYPMVKNVSAQSWSFKATATVLNTGKTELKSWKLFIGFQHNELLVSTDGAVIEDAEDLPVQVGKNGTTMTGYPMTDLKTAIDTAADITQMQAQITLKGTMFGVGASTTPMPKTIKLVNDGYKCPAPKGKSGSMHACCVKNPKFKVKSTKTKFLQRRHGDLEFTYDVMSAYNSKYLAQVTMENNHPLGRLDQWNLTWEWMRNEFINTMKGAYTHKRDPQDCIYGPQGVYYKDYDFSTVMNCEKKPVIADLPPQMENDDKVGKLRYCCKNGTLLPKTMNETKSKAIFQLEVFKLPPDLNRTALTPPQNWKITGRITPTYKCSAPIRVDPTEFPDPAGLDSTTSAVASWQVTCNMTTPRPREAKCCVSYSAFYSESDGVVPCNTCSCGCNSDNMRCDTNAAAMLLPADALLVPFANRTAKAIAFAKMKHNPVPHRLPCPDNCGVSINWHVDADYKSGWTARLTLFNWQAYPFADWFAAVQLKKAAAPGFEKAYTFNGTKLSNPANTVFMQGMPGLNYLVGEVNGTNPLKDPQVPGKQQTVISFKKKGLSSQVNIAGGDGFPAKFYFNGAECSLPKVLPKKSGAQKSSHAAVVPAVLLIAVLNSVFV